MKPKTTFTVFLLSLLCILLFSGCADTVEENPLPSEDSVQPTEDPSHEKPEGQTLTLHLYFLREDGTALGGQSVRLSDGENEMDYPLDEEGQLRITGLPRTGTYTVSVLEDNEEAGAIPLNLSVGSVIDAATDADGVGHVTLKEDTDAVSLEFRLDEQGTLSCTLRLSSNDGQGVSEV